MADTPKFDFREVPPVLLPIRVRPADRRCGRSSMAIHL